jgi:hypothetical protein
MSRNLIQRRELRQCMSYATEVLRASARYTVFVYRVLKFSGITPL